MISVGTGFTDYAKDEHDERKEMNEKYLNYKDGQSWSASMGTVFIKNLVENAAWAKGIEIYDDKTTEKKGLKDWINVEVVEAVLSGIDS